MRAEFSIITVPGEHDKIIFNVPFEPNFKINKFKMLFENF
ncbi:restriction endonuclease [Pediococcus acidilactici]|nr:restriction endonuclease [Pediococcus acidilactici]RXA15038.1 restriction endonuclease [Pediococcus acidilactici]RXA49778.1 restriction endonuclease [Pediococcus acidilactici]RXA53293.1 restriction endonuclease [Pediococcus acidilactici]RXA78460.1 restriction endonuclease [Pediococcus acidilactici]